MKITLPGIRFYIRQWIKTLTTSYREVDGVVRDRNVLREIAHLQIALRLLTKKNLRVPLGAFLSPSKGRRVK